MKRKIFTALAGLVALGAHAQSSVSLNGYADGSVVLESGGPAGSIKKQSSGASGPTRLIFRGTEDLGGGLSAFFHLEAGVLYDTGGSLQQNFFGRQSYVGVNGWGGNVKFGLVYVPLFTTLFDVVDPFRDSFAPMAGNIMTAGTPAGPKSVAFPNPSAVTGTSSSGAISRSNTILYTTPNFAGVTSELAYSFGEQSTTTKAYRTLGASLGYSQGPLTTRLAYERTGNQAGNDTARNLLFGANYDFKIVKAYFGFGVNKGYAALDNNELLVGVSVPVGVGYVLASYVRRSDKSPANVDPHQIGIGYTHYLSKRTLLHISAARITNSVPNTSPSFYTVSTPAGLGSGNQAIAVGIGHFF